MKKEEKEKYIISIRLKEIEGLDRDTTSQGFRLLLLGISSIGFFIINKPFTENIMNFIYILIFMFLLFVMWTNEQQNRHITDCYDTLCESISKGSIIKFKHPKIKLLDLFWYRRK